MMKRSAVVLVALAVAGCSHSGGDREQDLAQQVSTLQQENDDLRSKLQDAEVRAAQAEQGQSVAANRAEMRAPPPRADDADNDAGGGDADDGPPQNARLSPAERAAQAASDAADNGGPGN